MDIILITTIFSAVISVAAFIISMIALWQSHFSKFKSVHTVGTLRMKIYPIRSEGERWYIASLGVPISITNEGARAGKVVGLRIRASYPDLPISNNFEVFYPLCEVDYKIFEPLIHQRFEWLDTAVLGEWASFVILPKQTITKHLIFETRWDEPVIQENVHFELEMLTDTDRKWRELAKWEFNLSVPIWSELAEVGASFGCNEVSTYKIHGASINPPDLHKYTGTKSAIPKDGFNAKPSYLDYNTRSSKRRKKA